MLLISKTSVGALSPTTSSRLPESAVPLADSTRQKWPAFTRLRIVLAHHYHRIDPNLVRKTATTDVPALLVVPERPL
jgi:uncharacterized protein with HEPN domain